MDRIFSYVLETGIYSVFPVLSVLFIRRCFNTVPKKVICWLWLLVGLRLMFFIPMGNGISVIPRINIQEYVTEIMSMSDSKSPDVTEIKADDETEVSTGLKKTGEKDLLSQAGTVVEKKDTFEQNNASVTIYPVKKYDSQRKQTVKVETTQYNAERTIAGEKKACGILSIMGYIWLAGAAAFISIRIGKLIKCRKYLSTAVKMEGYDRVYCSDYIKSAVVFGVVRPRIYVSFDVKEEQLEYMLAHEQGHIKRHDQLINALGYVLVAFYWFVPWVWLSYKLYLRDVELACDEAVIRNKGNAYRASYARLLLEYSIKGYIIPTGMLTFSGKNVKERVNNIVKNKKAPIWVTGLVLILAVVSMAIFIPDRASKATDTEETDRPVITLETKEESPVQTDVTDFVSDKEEEREIYYDADGEEVPYWDDKDKLDYLYQYLDTEKRELIIPADVTEITKYQVAYIGAVHPTEYPVTIRVEEGNPIYDSRNNCNAIIETSGNKLIFGCENTVIPDSVTEIQANAFYQCEKLLEIRIPDSVERIGSSAFAKCRNLKTVILPQNIKEIEVGLFNGCSNLSSIVIPDSVKSIGSGAFNYCGRLRDINLSDELIDSGLKAYQYNGVFTGCYSLPKDIKEKILQRNPYAYPLFTPAEDCSDVEYHLKNEAPEQFVADGDYYYAVLDSIDSFGNISLRVVEYLEDHRQYVYTGESKIVRISDDCTIMARGKNHWTNGEMRYLEIRDLQYITDYYMVVNGEGLIEQVLFQEYVYPFICIEDNGIMELLRENCDVVG